MLWGCIYGHIHDMYMVHVRYMVFGVYMACMGCVYGICIVYMVCVGCIYDMWGMCLWHVWVCDICGGVCIWYLWYIYGICLRCVYWYVCVVRMVSVRHVYMGCIEGYQNCQTGGMAAGSPRQESLSL